MIENPATSDVFELNPTVRQHGTMCEAVIAGARTRWWVYGSPQGRPLVLVHGFRGDHHGLELIAQDLEDFKVIIPDLPGFGKSEPVPGAEHTVSTYAAWLANFLAEVVEQPVHLIGHSFGSIVTSYLAAAQPHLISKLTLINPICEPALEGDQKLMSKLAEIYYRAGALLPEPLGFGLLKSKAITRITSEFMIKSGDRQLKNFINGQHAAYFGAFVSREAVLEAYRASISSTAADFAPQVPRPVQMIVAKCDDLGTFEKQRSMFATLTQGRFDLIPEVGHLVHYETPKRAAALITDFNAQEAA
ncbi:MAG: alpha/beta hydrolase [Rothia sp. (in: high G+C Gram-positive bacteria)]|nr:alpha/beta hydrolase [Rothia sp. (in: high G+C Gram-positive bacteria)]